MSFPTRRVTRVKCAARRAFLPHQHLLQAAASKAPPSTPARAMFGDEALQLVHEARAADATGLLRPYKCVGGVSAAADAGQGAAALCGARHGSAADRRGQEQGCSGGAACEEHWQRCSQARRGGEQLCASEEQR